MSGVTDDGVVPVPPDGAEGRALHYAGQPDLLPVYRNTNICRQLLDKPWLGGHHHIHRGAGPFTHLEYFH